jgi:peptidyl-prolyl cis-trans isomerase SurA
MMILRPLAALLLGLALTASAGLPGFAAAIRITVNDVPISDLQIAQRAKLMSLERHTGNLTQAATEELIDEALELQDAKRYNITVSDADIQEAFVNMARGLKISPDKLSQVLGMNGVGMQTLKDRIRATLAFNHISQNVIAPRVNFSEADLAKQAAGKATAANSYDYILKEVMFLAPNGKGTGGRMGDAERYRAGFKGCDSAVQLSESFTDAAVTDVGRRHATQLPDDIAKELGSLPVGGITKPRADQGGASMLAICSKEKATDLTFITNQLRSAEGNDKLKTETDKYLADLRAKATIVRG